MFYRQRLGDVLLTYENEVVLTNQVRPKIVLGSATHVDAQGERKGGRVLRTCPPPQHCVSRQAERGAALQQQKHWRAQMKARQHLHCFTFAQHSLLNHAFIHSCHCCGAAAVATQQTTTTPPRSCAQVYGEDKALQYVVPSPNVRIECPLAPVDKVLENRPAAAREAATAFCNFLFTTEAQVRRRRTHGTAAGWTCGVQLTCGT